MKRKLYPSGPWNVWEESEGANPDIFIESGEGTVCEITGDPLPRRRAIAYLIAAAPELLEAAEELRAAFLDGCGDASGGPKRDRLARAGAALERAIALAQMPEAEDMSEMWCPCGFKGMARPDQPCPKCGRTPA